MTSFPSQSLLQVVVLLVLSAVAKAENLVVEVEDDPNNKKYNRAWSLWKFCGCTTASEGYGTVGGLGATADMWSMGDVFSGMAYDMDFMPLDPFIVHINTTWLYSDNFYSSVIAEYMSKEGQAHLEDGVLSEEEITQAKDHVYNVLAKQEQDVNLEYVHIGWDSVDEEGVFSFITDFRGHIPIRKGDEFCWEGMHMYNVSTTDIETVKNVMGMGGLALDFHVNEGLNLCKDVSGW